MKDVFKVSVMLVGMLFFCLACEDEKDPEPTPTPGEKAIEDVITALEDMDEDVSEFIEAMKKIGTVDLESDEVTVFAVKDDSGAPKASLLSAAPITRSISDTDVKRHIAKGRVNLASMSGDELELVSIGGDKLIVTKEGSEYLINGVEIESSTPVKAGNSYIYVVPEVIPTYVPGPEPAVSRTFKFLVQEVNKEFKEGDEPLFPAAQATIYIFKEVGDKKEQLDEIQTGNDGTATWKTDEEGDIYYSAFKGDASPFYEGYRIIGIATSQEELDNGFEYFTGTALDYRYIGALTVMDTSGDGKIDEEDKVDEYIGADENEDDWVNEVVISDMDIPEPSVDWDNFLDEAESLLNGFFCNFLEYAYEVDGDLISGRVGYPQMSGYPKSDPLWQNANAYFLFYSSYYPDLLDRDDCPAEVKQGWQDRIYPKAAMEIAYISVSLVNYFGSAFFTTPPVQWYVEDVIAQLQQFIVNVPEKESFVIQALLARLYLNEKEYERARALYDNIRNKGEFDLSADPANAKMNESIMGPYDILGDGQSFYYPLRYPEVLLGLAEACIETGNNMEAMWYINQIENARGRQPIIAPGSSQEEFRDALHNVSLSELRGEDKTFMLYKRWGILVEALRESGAESHNILLRITDQMFMECRSLHLKQNPGYL